MLSWDRMEKTKAIEGRSEIAAVDCKGLGLAQGETAASRQYTSRPVTLPATESLYTHALYLQLFITGERDRPDRIECSSRADRVTILISPPPAHGQTPAAPSHTDAPEEERMGTARRRKGAGWAGHRRWREHGNKEKTRLRLSNTSIKEVVLDFTGNTHVEGVKEGVLGRSGYGWFCRSGGLPVCPY